MTDRVEHSSLALALNNLREIIPILIAKFEFNCCMTARRCQEEAKAMAMLLRAVLLKTTLTTEVFILI